MASVLVLGIMEQVSPKVLTVPCTQWHPSAQPSTTPMYALSGWEVYTSSGPILVAIVAGPATGTRRPPPSCDLTRSRADKAAGEMDVRTGGVPAIGGHLVGTRDGGGRGSGMRGTEDEEDYGRDGRPPFFRPCPVFVLDYSTIDSVNYDCHLYPRYFHGESVAR